MKRRKLCNTKKLVAVILAASMVMGTGATAFADDSALQGSVHIGEVVSHDRAEVQAGEVHEYDIDLGT